MSCRLFAVALTRSPIFNFYAGHAIRPKARQCLQPLNKRTSVQMEKRVLISPFEKITDQDMTNLGLYPEQSLDDVVFDTIIPDQGYSGFATVQSAPTQVTVGNGRLYQAGAVYFNNTN